MAQDPKAFQLNMFTIMLNRPRVTKEVDGLLESMSKSLTTKDEGPADTGGSA